MASRSSPPTTRGSARKRLIEAAHTLVRRQGWSATSVDQICTAAGVTKGAFFHHFVSKEALGVAAAQAWTDRAAAHIFDNASLTAIEDPLERVLAHIDLRAALIAGVAEDYTCFVGTIVQETFATSDPLRSAGQASLAAYSERLAADIDQALDRYGSTVPVNSQSLAYFVQAVLQGAFVLAKGQGEPSVARQSIAHLRRYVEMLFGKDPAP
jgi:TetR/AcrR family transcriptional repressor of nem operon